MIEIILFFTIVFLIYGFYKLFSSYEPKSQEKFLYTNKGNKRICNIRLGYQERKPIYYPNRDEFDMTQGCGKIDARDYLYKIKKYYGADSMYYRYILRIREGRNLKIKQ